MSKNRFTVGYDNVFFDAEFQATVANGFDNPAAFIQNEHAADSITWDHPAPGLITLGGFYGDLRTYDVGCFAVAGIIGEIASIEYRLTNGGPSVYSYTDTAPDTSRGILTHFIPDGQMITGNSVQIRITPASTDPFTVSTAFAGSQLQMSHQFSRGLRLQNVSPARLVQTFDGSHYPEHTQDAKRALAFELEQIEQAELTELGGFERTVRTRPFIFSAFPTDPVASPRRLQYDLMGRLLERIDYTLRTEIDADTEILEARFSIVEI